MTAIADTAKVETPPTPPMLLHTDRVPFTRLAVVELRKMVDTRAGRWMLIVIASIAALACVAVLIWGTKDDLTFGGFVGITYLPLLFLLPVIGIMAATAEWTQRTGLVTFTLEPRRGLVVAAKVVAGVVLGLAVLAVTFAAAAIAELLAVAFHGGDAVWDMPWKILLGFVLALTLAVAQGLGFGLSILNTPVAIVGSFLLPTAWSIAGGITDTLNHIGVWLDLNRTLEPLLEGTMAAKDWAHLTTSAGVWIALPLAIGTWRVMTREVK